jgi:hypothetical protein
MIPSKYGWKEIKMNIMKQLRNAGLGFAVLLIGLRPAVANVTEYECRFAQERGRGGGWIPEILVLTENSATGEVVVFDPVIKHFIGEPITATMTSSSDNRRTFTWEFVIQHRGQSPRMIYDLTYFSNGRPAKMTLLPGGYDNSWSGDGTCKVTTR